ncbi:peptidase [Mycobacterium sp. 852013-51886_SCH5428379]|uniref:neutral zinc metallopeptidase n=1 Tax=Mycobacterium sp. 852013-51886_SCH5428379 TaxID=1834111 RepID=UPI0007FEBA84|nr:neutral zinc metallopeptidase [Mycobacterium sp. 852013-51886_SCH5428379]OBB56675.1 peptidase [Mycobacterium sp. 852013-51886_SCH5428379]
MGRRRLLGTVTTALALCAVSTAGCTTTLQGRPVSVFDDPFRVAGMVATDGPTGLRPDAAAPSREVDNTDGGEMDRLAASAISDIEDFWAMTYPEVFDNAFVPVDGLISWDSGGFDGYFCDSDTYDMVNAGFCELDNTIGWDRGALLPSLRSANGDMGVAMVLAHEYGHAVQHQAQFNVPDAPVLVTEQQADCFAGAYMRWVAEGESPRFSLNTGDGLNGVLAAVIAFRDPLFNEGDAMAGVDEHGSAFERVSAFQFGFTDGAASCAAIDLREIGQRRGDLPVLLPDDHTGELPVTEESVRSIVDAMNVVFAPAKPPELVFDADAAKNCPDARPSPPVSYCPATNAVVVDLAELEAMGAQPDDGSEGLAAGDNTAYSVLMSRYLQAVQHEKGLVLDSAEAALRTACLTGVATTELSQDITTPGGATIALTAGDLDEAVSGILTNGLAAGNVNGESVPSGFSRIDAFRVGVLGDQQRCLTRFP